MRKVLSVLIIFVLALFACRSEREPEVVDQREREKEQESRPMEEQQPPPPAGMEGARMNARTQMVDGQWPPPEGEAFLRHITDRDPYQQWQMWPGTTERYQGTEPHGAFLTTYVNEQALGAITDKAGEMPDRAIVVKENYTPEKELASITAMYKVSGYLVSAERPDGGEWFWIAFTPDGQINEQGKVESCIACHDRARDNDYLFTGYIGQ
jgi:hypothetical protein